ncbi:paraquat-inducible protein A [Shewanella sp. SP2S2-4]|jgi:paraquat-inducible protein A|uniref:Paraquat-inducible protein A n=1 Tax=Shewanella baltica (strain OS195) TaxID=399599 RepID=A9L4E3_SHEB9|nr:MULTISPECIES: paraquat-inducible protein A [Shewanella]ABS08582.1 Paraquat-inducible protein A [Shewanella baltica OS185]ABX49733.1 Paraquat-inducible protein A [Shewanella baltica OS195]ADT94719.1 Paraquat-inducible protein A [Shewanella baltica OS678]EHC05599.1 Paraquat-inducible protein A [Shewanella baltica OS625]MCS6112973.1 paraquat-inducible protein A [Shewanella baltica]
MKQQGKDIGLCLCKVCRQLNSSDLSHCQRCEAELQVRDYSSLQKSWALLITAAILLVPANIYPITMLTNQGQVRHDTIFSGILHLVHSDMLPIAVIVFTASILVPWIKIIGLSIYLCAISFDIPISKKKLMVGFHIIEWIGRWSMLDLFVISITVALVNMGQLLDAKPAPAATAFALVILLTQLAAKVLDTRLLWDRLEPQDDTN